MSNTKTHQIVFFKWVNYTVCEFYLNKTVFKIKLSKETENEFSVFLAMPLVLRGTVLA